VAGFDVVINAAGVADPRRPRDEILVGANAVQPAIVSQACQMAGVRRFLHVSTAAVQGSLDPLDESTAYQPLSPYALTKAEGERLVLDRQREAPPEVVVYRPASVHGVGRPATRTLARLARCPAVAVSGKGDQPVPVALVENVATGILFAATAPLVVTAPSRLVVLHPSEGMTARRLLEAFRARRIVSLPRTVAEGTLRSVAGAASARRSPKLSARVRWLELLWRGQSMAAVHLAQAGFVAPLGPEGWFELGRRAQAQLAAGRR
jgi:nucleoside-diphosphate-sugar epimerase